MKTTKRILIAALSIFTLMVIAGCSSKRNEGNKTGIDSTHTREYIAKISLQEPERALAIIDTMEMNNEERPYAINYLRFVVYNNGLADYKMADYYGKQVLKDSIELKQDCKRYYSLLNTLASIANSNSQFAQSIIYAKKAAEIARENNMKEYEVGAIGTVALSTIMLGDKESGLKMFSNNKDMVMQVMNNNPNFATADMAYSFMGNYVESLIAHKKYDEIEKNIPDLLYITNKLRTIENIVDGYAEYRQLHTYSILMNYYDAKGNKTLDEIATACGFGNAKAFNKKFHEHFGIQAEEYRKWSKNMSKQDKTNIEEAKQMKDSFIRNMSHEIRTPLNQIFGFVQLLTDPNIQLSDEEKRQYNDIISDQTTYMTRLINKFLELSEYESSDEPLPRETISIDETLNIVQSTVPQPQAGVELTFSNNSGKDTIDTNGKGLTRILQCLVGNAVKFTPSGYISVECITNAEGSVTFSVTDTGKGIPEGDEERIFDRFYKVDEFVPGAGLGLSLVREIARRMGATVVIDRPYAAKGSRFVVTLMENTQIIPESQQTIKNKTI